MPGIRYKGQAAGKNATDHLGHHVGADKHQRDDQAAAAGASQFGGMVVALMPVTMIIMPVTMIIMPVTMIIMPVTMIIMAVVVV